MLREEAAAIGASEQAEVWLRFVLLVSSVLLACAVLMRMWALFVFIPATLAGPLLYARVAARAIVRKLTKQTRVTEMLLAFLIRAGATLSDSLLILEKRLDAPIRDKLREVNVQKQYTTLPGALEALADSTGVSQLREMASLVSESERSGTPVSEALFRSIRLDVKMRDAMAAERYGKVQLEMAMYATLLIAMPGFGFALYAMLMFALHLLGSWSLG
ncbi:Flp pilus assembly protein TadB-like protein [Alicyclobacillus hesperidum URH17-3-68]|nr:Flp pilus assembly protein TadB-like protein [Alicyclobacillus hesperidum URH17-3-68]